MSNINQTGGRAMSKPDTNQASKAELKQRFATLFYDDNYEFMLSEPDLFDVGAIDAAVELIRTEKLKLLEEVMHQSTVNLKSAKAVAGWAELRKKQLEAEL